MTEFIQSVQTMEQAIVAAACVLAIGYVIGKLFGGNS